MAAKLAGSGGGRYNLNQNSDINVTPFVDILLVLLIIFMVAVPMATVSIKVDLPPATPPPENVKPKEPIFVSIRDDGLFIGAQPTTVERLVADMTTKIKEQDPTVIDASKERVMIRADANVLYDRFMTVINAFQTAGFYQVGLINEDIS
jgi:biopolymer transport protein ExbD